MFCTIMFRNNGGLFGTMDARIEKTKASLKVALQEVLSENPKGKIRVEDLLEKAHISRSTFYCHYKTIDDLVSSVSEDIFHHVFSHSLKSEKGHDFSNTSIFDTGNLITHILYHLKEEKNLIRAITRSQYASLFNAKFREEFKPIASTLSAANPKPDIPLSLAEEAVTEAFLLTVAYWEQEDFLDTPETISAIYFCLIR